jgi:hypothetical protein
LCFSFTFELFPCKSPSLVVAMSGILACVFVGICSEIVIRRVFSENIAVSHCSPCVFLNL